MTTEAEPDGFESWLRGRVPERGLRSKGASVLQVLLTQPRRVSYSSAAEAAELAGVNVATVSRTAQTLGFSGWSDLQQELRARYLSSLSAPEVAAAQQTEGELGGASLRRDLDSLAVLNRRLDEQLLRTIAEAIAQSRRTVIVANGSYFSVGSALGHNVQLAGYEATVVHDDAELANAVSRIEPGDVLIAISFWRLYQSTVTAAEEAHDRGARVFALTDAASPALAAASEQIVLIPAEGVAFFPSLAPGLAVAQAIAAQLSTVDPERTRRSIEAAETQWSRFRLLHRRPRRD
ncbi:MurR/RpiR family transcriptional regulator [Saccharopolyspora endophytica]|uniref:MurR/RpiR family transcriptional regulator n=1 Tax=Saccharopolyspora endophytica TaxID=543886 RepID=A0ABS5DNQ2_9PSEU|nr:MurR/RpiR family transcriptional regulator [Saccharopolyspora endophytica]MBQ0927840.1 MurR/RpiR family transcriptional regulator [Saccharopolyspora endophytica]